MTGTEDVLDAVRAGNVDRLKTLLTQDMSCASARDAAGVSAVLHAIYRGRQEMVELLLACRPHLDIFEAAALGRTDAVASRLDEDPSQAGAFSGDGFTALHLGAFFAHPEVVSLLLESGADPRAVARNVSMVTPLHSAAAGRSLDAVRLLLGREVDVNARQQGGWTALHSAALRGDTDLVRLLLARGASAHAVSDDGKTALDLALEKGHSEVVDLLGESR